MAENGATIPQEATNTETFAEEKGKGKAAAEEQPQAMAEDDDDDSSDDEDDEVRSDQHSTCADVLLTCLQKEEPAGKHDIALFLGMS